MKEKKMETKTRSQKQQLNAIYKPIKFLDHRTNGMDDTIIIKRSKLDFMKGMDGNHIFDTK